MRFIRLFRDIGLGDVPVVGGKNASLGELLKNLAPLGVNVPDGFAVTAEGYRHFLREARIDEKLDTILRAPPKGDVTELGRRSERVRELITSAPLPPELLQEITESYAALSKL